MTGTVITIGDLARRTGVRVKTLRRHVDMGLIYTRGRSPAGYRLFDEDALWCVQVIRTLRALGLTESEIQQLAASHDECTDLVGPHLARLLERSRARVDERIRELEQLHARIDQFQHQHQDALAGQPSAPVRPWGPNPKYPGHTY